MLGDIGPPASAVVEPVHPEEIQRIGEIVVDVGESGIHVGVDERRIRQLGEGRQPDALFAESLHHMCPTTRIGDVGGELGRVAGGKCLSGAGRLQ